jgi:hypothetical protein
MANFRTISDITTDIYEMSDKRFSHARVLRGVRQCIEDLGFFNKSQIGIVSDIIIVDSNLNAPIPPNSGGITKVAIIKNGVPYQLDRQKRVPTKEGYALHIAENKKCANCTCDLNTCKPDFQPTSLVSNEQSLIAKDDWCPYSTFFNVLSSNSYMMGAYRLRDIGAYYINTEHERLEFSGVRVGQEVLIEYKKTKDASQYQLVPKEAFKMIMHGCLAYIDSSNPNHELMYRSAKKQFDLLKTRETYSLEQIVNVLRGY